ncbi:MAG: HD domain-containing protein [Spirochaetes bacterium]|nr:HD domain-containing protein [Spirochaetota bacterium]
MFENIDCDEYINHCKEILKKLSLNQVDFDIYKEYQELLNRYLKILKEYEAILKISDQLEESLNQAQKQLIEKNKMLSDKAMLLKELVDQKTEQIKEINLALINALEMANYENDQITGLHIRRVAKLSFEIAKEMKLDNEFIQRIEMYSVLHDVGKVGIPNNILQKEDSYTEEEFNIMKKHTEIGAKMLSSSGIDQMARNIALYHHEYWNGNGYPYGIKENDIPLEARIVAVADVFDALFTKRHYKESLNFEYCFEYIINKSGIQFDPKVVEAFKRLKQKIKEIYEK